MALGCDKIQGYFTSTGKNVKLNIPIGADTCNVWNYTVSGLVTPTAGFRWRWQLGMPDYGGIIDFKNGSSTVVNGINDLTSGKPGFLLFNDPDAAMSAPLAVTAVSNAAQFVVTAADTGDLVDGDIVRLYDTGTAFNTRGFPFQVSNVVANTSFTIAWPLANAPGAIGAGGTFRIVYASPQTSVAPTNNFVIKVTQAAQAVVTFSVAHNYQVGQTVRFSIPNGFGMTELDGLSGTVLAIDTVNNTITVDINTLGFSPFVWVDDLLVVHNWATCSPAYMNTAAANQFLVNPYNDARTNINERGLVLFAGDFGPAGNDGDLIFWEVTSSTTNYITLPTL